ncbi:hypothetical protein [Niveibacterium sp. SC-1]|uniref:hypothetical protein n=1 Tax=Niveibacterium sp. SC-1 TaxID=3135646 RepID=UPI00311E3C6C
MIALAVLLLSGGLVLSLVVRAIARISAELDECERRLLAIYGEPAPAAAHGSPLACDRDGQ